MYRAKNLSIALICLFYISFFAYSLITQQLIIGIDKKFLIFVSFVLGLVAAHYTILIISFTYRFISWLYSKLK